MATQVLLVSKWIPVPIACFVFRQVASIFPLTYAGDGRPRWPLISKTVGADMLKCMNENCLVTKRRSVLRKG